MMAVPCCDTNADLVETVRQSGRAYEVLAKTIYGLDLVCVRTGGHRLPAIVITAGAHAGEPAGVLAALSLVCALDTDHVVYIVPLRDPFGWGGFAQCLALALGEPVTVDGHEDAERLLTERGTVVHREEAHALVVALIGDLVFASMRPLEDTSGPRDIERRLNTVLQDRPELVPLLAGKRTCWPSNLPGVEGCGNFDRAFSAFVTWHGVIADLNRQFTFAYPPVEVACVRELVDRVKPGLLLDLHESQGSKFFLFGGTSPFEEGENQREIALAILEAIAERGGRVYRLNELLARPMDPELAKRLSEPLPGIVQGNVHNARQGASLGAYCQRYGTALTVETGRWRDLPERVAEQLAGTLAGIRAFEKLCRA